MRIALTETVKQTVSFQVMDDITAIRALRWDNLLLLVDPDTPSDIVSARRILAEYNALPPSPLGRALMHTIDQLHVGTAVEWNRFEESILKQIMTSHQDA